MVKWIKKIGKYLYFLLRDVCIRANDAYAHDAHADGDDDDVIHPN